MVEADNQALNKERATEIFNNIFSEIYLAMTGNPIDFETTMQAIEKEMKLQFQDAQTEQFEKFFQDCDANNARGLKKE